MLNASLLDNHTTVDVLQRLLFSETKPSSLTSIDISILTYLVLRRCIDHEIFDSHDTIARRVNVKRGAVMRSLKRLDRLKWVTVGGRGIGRTKAISVNLESFPAAQPVRDKITEEAKLLVQRYVVGLHNAGRKKFPKNWNKRQAPSAQRILSSCGGDVRLAHSMMVFAFNHPQLKARAQMSLYHMFVVWNKVSREYEKAVAAQAARQQAVTAKQSMRNRMEKTTPAAWQQLEMADNVSGIWSELPPEVLCPAARVFDTPRTFSFNGRAVVLPD